MNLSIEHPPIAHRRNAAVGIPAVAGVLALMAALWIPLVLAPSAPLSSDESLYLAEAENILNGDGFTYPSGEAITHRAPLYPLALASAIAVTGDGGAYAVSKAVIVVNALLIMALAWRVGGAVAGTIAGFAASASAYLNGLGTTLYLDPLECAFLLAALLALVEALRSPSAGWFAVAGFWTGLAFLAKESAIEWLPLALCAWLAVPALRSTTGARGVLLFVSSFGLVVAPWWAWVFAHTGQLYLLGEPHGAAVAILAGSVCFYGAFAGAVVGWPNLPACLRQRLSALAMPLAVVFVLCWGAFLVYGLTRYSTWPFPNDYLETIPGYLKHVAPQAQPFFLMAGAWCVVAVRAARGCSAERLLALAVALFAPFAMFIANRGLQLRDALPIVYISYAALGIGSASLIGWLRRHVDVPHAGRLIAAGVAAIGVAFAAQQAAAFQREGGEAAPAWDSPFVESAAAWMSGNLPPGANVLSSRLYFSSLHTATHGRFRIRQMPTVRVELDSTQSPHLVEARSNLFRWEDERLRPTRDGDTWLFLRRFPDKGYWVGLSQEELLEYIVANEIDYVVLTGEDVAFSTLQYADYFGGHAAFTLLHRIRASSTEQFFAYAVDRDALFRRLHSTVMSPADLIAFERASSMSRREIEAALGTPLRVTDLERGLSVREEWAALGGLDLGLKP